MIPLGTRSTASLHEILPGHGPDLRYVYVYFYPPSISAVLKIYVITVTAQRACSGMHNLFKAIAVIGIRNVCADPHPCF